MGRPPRIPTPAVQLGRFAKRPKSKPAPAPTLHMPPPGEHLWVLMRWDLLTPTQAAAVAAGSHVEPRAVAAVARQVGCYRCHIDYARGQLAPCEVEEQPVPEPVPLDTPTEPEVPVDPPTPPDAEPPVVELAQPMSETALTLTATGSNDR